MRILTQLPQDELAAVPSAARAAETAGFNGLTTSENKNDPFLALAVAAVATQHASLQTSIAIAFSRSPMAVANVCWDLQSASRGRFVLGLGSQVRAHNENRFSVPWTAPAPRMREYVLALRAIWRNWEKGEKLDFRGTHYKFTLMTPNFTPASTHQPPIPVTIAAVGPAMLRVAGEVCDGVRLHGFCTRRYVDEVVMRELRAGMAKSGRTRETFEIAGGGFIATGRDEESVAKMVEWVRYRVAFYGSTPAYWPVLEAHGLHDLGRKLNVMSKAGQWDQAIDHYLDAEEFPAAAHLLAAHADEIFAAERFDLLRKWLTRLPERLLSDGLAAITDRLEQTLRPEDADALPLPRRRLTGKRLSTWVQSWAGAAIGLAVGLSIWTAQPLDGLDTGSMHMLGLLAWAVIFWAFDVLPDYVVGLCMIIAWILFAIVPPEVAVSGFTSSPFFLIIGVLGITASLQSSGLLFRLALHVLRCFPLTYRGQAAGLALSGTAITTCIPDTTSGTAIAGPIILALSDSLGYTRVDTVWAS